MNDLNKLEKHLKTTTETQKSTPPSFVWDEIDKAIPKKKNNRLRLFICFFFGLVFFAILIFQGQNFTGQKNKISTRYYSAEQEETLLTEGKTNKLSESKNDSPVADKNGLAAKVTTNKEIEVKQKQKQIKTNETAPIKVDEINSRASQEKKIPNSNKPIGGNKPKEQNPNPLLAVNDRRNDNMINSNSQSDINTGQLIQQKILSEKTIDKVENIVFENKLTLENSFIDIPQIARLDISVQRSDDRNIKINGFAMYINSGELPVDEPNQRNKFFLDFGSMIGLHNTHLSQTQSGAAAYRLNTESNWYTWGAKLNFGFKVSKNLYLKTGVDFIESRDKFAFNRDVVQMVPSNDSSIFNTVSGTYFNVGDITYRQWNIPITIGIERESGKFIYGFEGTALYNMRFSSEGKTQVAEADFSRVENEQIFKSKLGFGYSGALMIGAKLNENNILYIKPSYTRYMSNTSLENSPVESKLSLYYLEFAYRKWF